MYICICVGVYIHIHMYIYIYIHTYTCTYIYMYTCLFVHSFTYPRDYAAGLTLWLYGRGAEEAVARVRQDPFNTI